MCPFCYDLGLAFFEALGLARWRKGVARRANGRVLVVGAGTGRNLPYFRSLESLTLTDVDPDMLERARKRAARLRIAADFLVADAQALPFADESFDTVVSTLVFCSIPDPNAAFREVGRVLKPGGTLELLEHVRTSRAWVARFQDALTPAWMRVADGCHLNRPTLEIALAAGFEPIGVRRSLDGWLLDASLRRAG